MGLKLPQSLGYFNSQLTFTVVVLMLSAFNFGMDNGMFGSTQAMPAFLEKFGEYDPTLKRYAIVPYFLSLYNSLTYVGQASGILLGGYIQRKWGRRMSLFIMCFWAILSAILIITAETKEQLIVGRILGYVYIGQNMATVPIMQAEICPARIRGFVLSTYFCGDMVGAFTGALVCYGTSTLKSAAAYRIPFGIFFIIPCIVIAGMMFSPESPRWLILKDRHSEALESLRRYRKGRFTEEEVLAEFEIQVTFVAKTQQQGSFREMWHGTNLKRSCIGIFSNFWAQITGQAFVSKYSTVFLRDVNALNPFAMQCINTSVFIAMAAMAMFLMDKTGRRPLLLAGNLLQAGSFITMGALGARTRVPHSYALGISAMLTLNYAGFCFGWGPIYHIVTSEVATTRLRDLTLASASFVNVLTQFVVSFTVPYLLYQPYANLGPKLGFVYGSLSVCGFVFSYFCVPECRGLSLEEVDHLFLQKTPLRKFEQYRHGYILPEAEIHEVVEEKFGSHSGTVELREFA